MNFPSISPDSQSNRQQADLHSRQTGHVSRKETKRKQPTNNYYNYNQQNQPTNNYYNYNQQNQPTNNQPTTNQQPTNQQLLQLQPTKPTN